MSTSCFPNRFSSKPISSAFLDSLMSSYKSTDATKSSEKEILSSKNCSIPDDPKARRKDVLEFTPSQVRKTVQRPSSESRGSNSTETSSPARIKCSTPYERSSSPSEKRSSDTKSYSLSPDSASFVPVNSSLYMTPESTPKAVRTPDVIIRPRVKRALDDHYRDEHLSSANSSLSCSTYYTPDSSPNDQGSAKRIRSRWSTPHSMSYASNNSDILSGSQGNLLLCDKGVLQPELIGYQMVGDSQFCRFGQQLLGLERVATPHSKGRIGICVSGQTITDLHRRVKEKFYPLSEKIILMIGTNDFLRNVDIAVMCKELSLLIRTLQETVTNIVLLTLPPIPKLERKQNMLHFNRLDKYNSYIRSLQNGDKLRIADVSPMYMTSPPYHKCRMHLFELYFAGPTPRHDLIHLNRQGLEVIRKYILDNFL